MYYKAHETLKKAQRKQYKSILERFSANLCLILVGMRKEKCNTTRSHWRTIPTLRRQKKDVGTRIHGHTHWMQKVHKDHCISAATFKDAKPTCKRLYHEYTAITGSGNTHPSRATSPTKAQSTVCESHEELRISTWCFHRMAILSFFHNAFAFIFVITMATKQRLVVNVELGVVGFFIWWTVIFVIVPDEWFSLARNLISWQSTRVCDKNTNRSHVFLMRILAACLSQLFVTVVQVVAATLSLTPRICVTQARHEAHLCVSPKKCSRHFSPCRTPHLWPHRHVHYFFVLDTLFLTYLTYTAQRVSTLCRSAASSEWRSGRALDHPQKMLILTNQFNFLTT